MGKKRATPPPAAEPGLQERANWGGTPTDRLVICPATEHLHSEPVAISVYLTSKKRRPTASCACGTRVWLGPTVNLESLLVADQALELGCLWSQRDQLLTFAWEGAGQPRYVVCPASGSAHNEPHAVRVKRGPKAFFAKCAGCWTMVFMGKRWTHEHGFPEAVARARGMHFEG